MPMATTNESRFLSRNPQPPVRRRIGEHPLNQSPGLLLTGPQLGQFTASILKRLGQAIAKRLELIEAQQPPGPSPSSEAEIQRVWMRLSPELTDQLLKRGDLTSKLGAGCAFVNCWKLSLRNPQAGHQGIGGTLRHRDQNRTSANPR